MSDQNLPLMTASQLSVQEIAQQAVSQIIAAIHDVAVLLNNVHEMTPEIEQRVGNSLNVVGGNILWLDAVGVLDREAMFTILKDRYSQVISLTKDKIN